jgi:hypothetical protein
MRAGTRTLVVVDGRGDWPALARMVPQGGDVAILAFVDQPMTELVDRLTGCRVEILPAARLLRDHTDDFVAAVRNWLAPLATACAGIEGWQATRLFEWNYAHPEWFERLRLACLRSQLAGGAYTACVIAAAEPFASAAATLAGGIPVTVLRRASDLPAISLPRALLRRLLDAVAEARILIKARALPRPARAEVLGYATYPATWAIGPQSAVYRYFGPHLPDLVRGFAVLATVSRMQIRRLRPVPDILRSLDQLPPKGHEGRLAVIESFGTWRDILACYCDPRPAWRFRRAVGRAAGRAGEFGRLYADSVIQSAINDLPRSQYLARTVARTVKAMGASVVVAPTYELAEGRAVALGAHAAGARVVGIQQGSQTACHLWRTAHSLAAIGSATGDHSATPDLLLAESELDAAAFTAAGLACPVAVIGAMRIEAPQGPPREHPSSAAIVVLGELHAPALLPLRCLTMVGDSGVRVIVRPHPLIAELTRTMVSAASPGSAVEWSDMTRTLAEELDRHHPLAVIVGVTGAAIEVALAGWPVAILPSAASPLANPLARAGQVFEAFDPHDFQAWLKRLENRDDRLTQGMICYEAARKLVSVTGRAAAERCRDILSGR